MCSMYLKCIAVFVILSRIFISEQLRAEEEIDFWPGADYNPTTPTFESVLGYSPGKRITWYRDSMRYFEALAQASPERIVITPYAKSWEGRQLYYVAISSPENIKQLDIIKSNIQQLSDPRKTDSKQAKKLVKSLPAIVWLSYGVHGNEISSTDAAMLMAYHLLAARGDERVTKALDSTVIIIDPLQNPDGRDRFIHNYEIAAGLVPDTEAISAEHNEPWPSGRSNHYLFDLNRDWFIQTQPETQGRIRALLDWYPTVYVDAHEMDSNSTYFFPPDPMPDNPHLTSDQKKSILLFGKNNARWFDRYGIDYFTREIFDSFYPGYGSSWVSYLGSIAMTFEQATTRGLVIRRDDGQVIYYRDAVRNHFLTSLATVETATNNREHLLTKFYKYRVKAVEEGRREPVRTYILPKQNDQPAVDKLARLLTSQGVEVGLSMSSFKGCGQFYDSGSYVIRADQPANRLIRTLMDIQVPIKESFMNEQEIRRMKKQNIEIYDVTAWSLPLMFNVRVDTCKRSIKGRFVTVSAHKEKPKHIQVEAARVAYLAPWGTAPSIRFLAGALRRGFKVKSSEEEFTHQNKIYPAGTLILDIADNPQNLAAQLTELATSTGVKPVPIDDSWVTDGPSFGSVKSVTIHAPRIGIAWDYPVDSYCAGNTRFLIERQFQYPVSPIRVRQLKEADLSRYQVLILPAIGEGSYKDEFGEEGVKNLKEWVNRGGVLLALGSANRFLADPKINLLEIRRENSKMNANVQDSVQGDVTDTKKQLGSTVAGKNLNELSAYHKAIAPKNPIPDAVSGALIKAVVDPDHWLSAGVSSSLNVLVSGSDIYTPVRLDKGVNVVRFADAEELLVSGYVWKENIKQLAYKPFVVVQPTGKGHVIGFTQDPNVRAYLDGLNVIFMNAVFRGAAHAKPLR